MLPHWKPKSEYIHVYIHVRTCVHIHVLYVFMYMLDVKCRFGLSADFVVQCSDAHSVQKSGDCTKHRFGLSVDLLCKAQKKLQWLSSAS